MTPFKASMIGNPGDLNPYSFYFALNFDFLGIQFSIAVKPEIGLAILGLILAILVFHRVKKYFLLHKFNKYYKRGVDDGAKSKKK